MMVSKVLTAQGQGLAIAFPNKPNQMLTKRGLSRQEFAMAEKGLGGESPMQAMIIPI